jgi:branched-subunit amino acid transport protein
VSPYAVVLVAGAASYACRLGMIVLGRRTGTPALLERAAPFVVPVTFAAVAAAGAVAGTEGVAAIGARAVAVVVAVAAVRRTGRAQAAVVAGMPTLWALNALLSV